MLQFGPDGYVWVSSCVGANASDQGQNPRGTVRQNLRLDVDSGDPYGIPEDNPFVDGAGGPRCGLTGFRNPWRFAIDFVDNNIYIADVGSGVREEVNVLSLATGGGSNLGWAHVEGTMRFQLNPCHPADYVLSAIERSRGRQLFGNRCVYRGQAIPDRDGVSFTQIDVLDGFGLPMGRDCSH